MMKQLSMIIDDNNNDGGGDVNLIEMTNFLPNSTGTRSESSNNTSTSGTDTNEERIYITSKYRYTYIYTKLIYISKLRCTIIPVTTIIFCILLYALTIFNYERGTSTSNNNGKEMYIYNLYKKGSLTKSNIFPKELLNVHNTTASVNFEQRSAKKDGVYMLDDFRNDAGRTVPYFEAILSEYNVALPSVQDEYDSSSHDGKVAHTHSFQSKSKILMNNSDYDFEEESIIIPHLGPCYLPYSQIDMNQIQWDALIEKNFNHTHYERNITYPPQLPEEHQHHNKKQDQDKDTSLANYCRPGFIIIGAGKCGTSSLYHYLIGHNRVAPAKQKQIHYFKYFTDRPMSWYLSHFYNTQDFLSSGSLVTGEASPGYMPYPDVAFRIKAYMTVYAGNGNDQPVALPKIITIVRNPLERSYSSYNYNYIEPAIKRIISGVKKARKYKHTKIKKNGTFKTKEKENKMNSGDGSHTRTFNSTRTRRRRRRNLALKRLRNNRHNNYDGMILNIISQNMTRAQIIEEYFFSFEQMIDAELKVLKECLKDGGKGETGAKEIYGKKSWAKELFQRREDSWNQTMWKTTVRGKKSHNLPRLITLDESCYGKKVPRSQWDGLVKAYPNKVINVPNLHLVQSLLGRSIYSLPLEWWYGLYPKQDLYLVCNEDLKYRTNQTMAEVTAFLGLPKFNFDKVVNQGMYNVGGNEGYDKVTNWTDISGEGSAPKGPRNNIPISDELRKKYLSFVKPYNERLFELAGKRCDW